MYSLTIVDFIFNGKQDVFDHNFLHILCSHQFYAVQVVRPAILLFTLFSSLSNFALLGEKVGHK